MNREVDTEGTLDQLRTFNGWAAGSGLPDQRGSPPGQHPYDASADLDRRARSYLQVNCAHCHQFNAGGTANIALGFELPIDQTKTSASGRSRARSTSPRPGSSPPAIPRARCSITASPSSAAAGCRGSDRTRWTGCDAP